MFITVADNKNVLFKYSSYYNMGNRVHVVAFLCSNMTH